MPSALAEVQAEVLTEAFTVNLDALVTKDYFANRLDARFAEQKADSEARFTEFDSRLLELEARLEAKSEVTETRFGARLKELEARVDARLARLEARVDARFAALEAKVDNHFRFFMWTQAIVLSAVVYPYLERMMA